MYVHDCTLACTGDREIERDRNRERKRGERDREKEFKMQNWREREREERRERRFAKLHFTSLHLSLNLMARWGTADDFTTRFLHFSLFSTAL